MDGSNRRVDRAADKSLLTVVVDAAATAVVVDDEAGIRGRRGWARRDTAANVLILNQPLSSPRRRTTHRTTSYIIVAVLEANRNTLFGR